MRDNLVVAVRGTGVAAACCHALLGAAGVGVQMEVTDRPRGPAVMLSPATQALLSDVFGPLDLFDGLWRIERRVVALGRSTGGRSAGLGHRGVRARAPCPAWPGSEPRPGLSVSPLDTHPCS